LVDNAAIQNGGLGFCVGGTIEDRHAGTDPAEASSFLLVRTITCPDGSWD
jgi:hypothetical protein